MKKIDRLRKEALQACKWRGHIMEPFKPSDFWPQTKYAPLGVSYSSVQKWDQGERPVPKYIALLLECLDAW